MCTISRCIDGFMYIYFMQCQTLFICSKMSWIGFKNHTFKVDEHEHYERVECGDLNIYFILFFI